MRRFITVLLVVLFAGQVFGQCEFFGTIRGEDGEPIVGANVVIPELNKGAISNENGKFSIKGVPLGYYLIQVSYIGLSRVNKEVEVKKGVGRYLLNFQLGKAIFSFDQLVIHSTRVDENAPFAFEVLSGEELEEQNVGQDMPMLLKWSPSVVTTSDAGAGVGYTGMRIRGSDGERINVTINGIPLNDSESQRVYWVDLPDFGASTDDIQIQRGVGASTNGSGAFGASINLSTTNQKEDAFAKLSGAIGSFNTWKRSVSFGSGLLNDRWSVEGRLSKITSDGYIDRASSDLSSYAVSTSYKGKASMLRFNLFSGHEITYQAWYGIDAESAADEKLRTSNPAGTEKAGAPYENQVDDYRQTHYQLLYDWQLSNNFKMQSAVHYTKGGGFYEEYKADVDYSKYGFSNPTIPDTNFTQDLIRKRWLENDFYGGLLTGKYTADNMRTKITFGGAYHRYEGRHFGQVIWARYATPTENNHVYYDNDATKNDGNIFAKMSYQFKPNFEVFGDLQLRKVDYSFFGVNDDGARGQQAVDYLFFNPKIGFTYQINNKLKTYLSAAIANREPNRNDLVDTPVSKLPSAERLLDIEAGANGSVGKVAWKANLFLMSYDNQLALTGQINDVGEYTRINVPKSSRQGIELQMKWFLSTSIEMGLSATLSRNKVKAFDEYIDTYDSFEDFNWLEQTVSSHKDVDLAFSPAVLGNAYIAYSPKEIGFKLKLQSKYVGKQYIDMANDEDNHLPAYTYTDFSISYKFPLAFTKHLQVSFIAKNIFNELYSSNAWSYRYRIEEQNYVSKGLYPQAGGNYYLMMNWAF